jgi:hypothetical protein
MSLLYEREALKPTDFYLRDPAPEVITWQGREGLRLSGQGACLALLPDLSLAQGRIEVDIGTEGPAYAGIVFKASDTYNYELAYAQPHTSGRWDALQYDPVFHGSNTWQLYHGPGAQQVAQVPTGAWFRLSAEFRGKQAIVRLGEQPPLFIHRLAHGCPSGMAGLWTYLPAIFANLRIWDDLPDFVRYSFPTPPEPPAAGTLMEWFLDGFGKVTCEPSGILNLNRYLPVGFEQVRLRRWIEMEESGSLTLRIGFSDALSLCVDEEEIFRGENLFHNSPHWAERGYVSMDTQVMQALTKGRHQLTAILQAKEGFGFGMALAIDGDAHTILPATLCG